MLSLRASCCKEPVTHRTREKRTTVPESLLSRLEVVSGSVTTFSNPFSLSDGKQLHLGFQRQEGAGKGLGASPPRPALCLSSEPQDHLPPSHTQAPGHPSRQPHHWGHIQRRQQPGELEAGRVDGAPVQGPASERGASVVQSEGLDALLNATAEATAGGGGAVTTLDLRGES